MLMVLEIYPLKGNLSEVEEKSKYKMTICRAALPFLDTERSSLLASFCLESPLCLTWTLGCEGTLEELFGRGG